MNSIVKMNGLSSNDPLPKLIQKENIVGWVFHLDYEHASVVANDLWKARAGGVPHNSYLLAASFDPEEYTTAKKINKTIILLRVTGACPLPQDEDIKRMKVDYYQENAKDQIGQDYTFDEVTQHLTQHGGLKCRVVGSFYQDDKGQLRLGSDIESYLGGMKLEVYRPSGEVLETIVNYQDPLKAAQAKEELEELGVTTDVDPIRIGTVRYTSTERLHRADESSYVPVYIQPMDFLARRTAVLGMTRTGKSNMVKQTVSVVKRISQKCDLPIGQLIYDPNGEYSNPNAQDKGAISEVYGTDVVRYRIALGGALPENFRGIQNDFYEQIQEGYDIICTSITEYNRQQPDYSLFFSGISFAEPASDDYSGKKRWQMKIAIYQAVLKAAGFTTASGKQFFVPMSQGNHDRIAALYVAKGMTPPKKVKNGLYLKSDVAVEYLTIAREVNKETETDDDGNATTLPLKTSSGNLLFDNECLAMLNMLARKTESDRDFNGYLMIREVAKYHSPGRNQDVAQEIYEELVAGKIVIVDLSVGPASLREQYTKGIAAYVFERSMEIFTSGKTPPFITVYIEEAHNLIGKKAELTETWPRIAKEGAKFRIGLVYSTQEPSSVHRSVLSATENWIVTHLNNENEIREIAKFYDFDDYRMSLLRAQDVGFARVKTLTGPFVVPTQIDKFDPAEEKRIYEASKTGSGGN